MNNRSNPLSELARFGFESLGETVGKLDKLVDLVGDWGHSALDALSKSASPDRALNQLLRLAEKEPKPLGKLLQKNDAAIRLCRILGLSDGLSEHILRHPQTLGIFAKKSAIPKTFVLSDSSRSDLRVSYRNALLQIADWDIAQGSYLEAYQQVSRALSDLTDAVLEAALLVAKSELAESGLNLDGVDLAVIAMGKTGAQELNYISDVDVIYVVDGQNDDLIGAGTRWATRLAAVLGEADVEPGLWELDANLRPEGKQGALVRTLEAHRSYYEKWAEPWEFQALFKARFAAGSRELGSRYIETIKPMIWSFPERNRIVESARHLRGRVLEQIPSDQQTREVKLGRGGLRDVEFTAQLMQLVHGATEESLRVMDTLSALEALSNAGLLSRDDRAVLDKNYRILRTLEHRIQLLKLKRTHLLPSDQGELRRIARSLDLKMSVDQLLALHERVRQEVATLHDSVFYRPLLTATAALSPGEVQLSSEDVLIRLSALGFSDPQGAVNHIAALTQGVSRRATIQRTLLPVLIRWMAEGTEPDRALLSFRRLSEALGETHWFLKMLRDSSGAAERLMRVLSSSSFIARILDQIPDSSAWFGDESALRPSSSEAIEAEMKAVIDRYEDDQAAAELIRQIRRREVLRVAIGAVLGALNMSEISSGLTAIMDAYIRGMLEIATRGSSTAIDFGVIAMGRWGGAELGFGSDADAMLIYLSDDEAAQSEAERISSNLQALVKDSLMKFEIDLDLRPEGKNGPRVRSLGSYANYYEKWAETWEFQALLRARIVAGSDQLRVQFDGLIAPYRYPEKLSASQLTDIRRIKARVETERLPQGADPSRHLKLGKGSVSDVEWLVQLFQLRLAVGEPRLRTQGTLDALEALAELGHITDQQAKVLRAGWLISSRCRSALVLSVDKLLDILPTDIRQLEAMARIMEYPPGSASQLEQDYLSATRRSRAVYEELFLK
jgi:glutamate-ammonia-ligase adenylyltransferase